MAAYRNCKNIRLLFSSSACYSCANKIAGTRCISERPLRPLFSRISVRNLHRLSYVNRTSRCLPQINGPSARAVGHVRWSSTASSFGNLESPAATLLSDATELSHDIATNLSPVADNAAAVLTALSTEPTLASLGLGGWMPSGFVQTALETIHVGLDVPWWTAIVIGTVCIRLAMFPLVILAQRNAANMHNHLPTMQRLQERMTQARMSGDIQEAVKTSGELMNYMQNNGVNPFKNMLVPFAQMPVFLSVFVGVREMTSLPVASLQSGGILWFTDLTIPDPFYALPLLTMTTLLATIEVGVDGVKAGQMGGNIKYMLRVMPFVCFPFIMHFPAAMLCYWFTSNTFSLLQVLFLRIPGIKTFFKIPELIDHSLAAPMKEMKVEKKSFMEGFRQTMTNIKLASEMEERKRLNALRLKEPTNNNNNNNNNPLNEAQSLTDNSKKTDTPKSK